MRFPGIDAGVAGVAMAEADGRLEMVFTAYDEGLYHGETALDETASELVVPAELIASAVVFHSEPSRNLLLFASGDAAVAFRRDGAPAVAVRRAGGPWAITVVDPDLGSYGRVALAGTSADDLHIVYEANEVAAVDVAGAGAAAALDGPHVEVAGTGAARDPLVWREQLCTVGWERPRRRRRRRRRWSRCRCASGSGRRPSRALGLRRAGNPHRPRLGPERALQRDLVSWSSISLTRPG